MRIKLSTRLERTKRWHLRLLLVGLSVFLSEAVTCAMGLLLKGEVSSDYLLTGLVVSLFVASLIVAMVGFFLERLNDSQLQLQNIIFNTAPVGVLTTDRSFHVTRANAKMLDMLGYSMEELSLLTIMDLTHGEDREMVRECLNQLMGAKGSALLHGKRKVRKNCSVFWADLALSTLQSSGDPAGGMLAIISDISERKQLEETLRVARIGIEHSSDFVFLVNAEAGFIDVNYSGP